MSFLIYELFLVEVRAAHSALVPCFPAAYQTLLSKKEISTDLSVADYKIRCLPDLLYQWLTLSFSLTAYNQLILNKRKIYI